MILLIPVLQGFDVVGVRTAAWEMALWMLLDALNRSLQSSQSGAVVAVMIQINYFLLISWAS